MRRARYRLLGQLQPRALLRPRLPPLWTASAVSIHTIPIPRGWSVEQAWEAIVRKTPLTFEAGEDPRWANVETDEQDRFVRVLSIEDDAEQPPGLGRWARRPTEEE